MAESNIDRLSDQLMDDPDPKIKRDAAKKLGEMRDPNAISALVQAYNSNFDPPVQKAIRDALMVYRRMEADVRPPEEGETPEAEETPKTGGLLGRMSGAGLKRVRNILLIGLVVALLGNLGLIAVRALRTLTTNTEPQTITERKILEDFYQFQVDTIGKEASDLYPNFTTFQTEIEQSKAPPKGLSICDRNPKVPETKVATRELSKKDSEVHVDMVKVAQKVNLAATKFLELRQQFATLCGIDDYGKRKDETQKMGGAASLVTRLGEVNSVYLVDAKNELNKAIKNPYQTPTPVPPTATNTPSITPTPTDTLTPTITPTATMTFTPGPSPTGAQPTAAATSAATQKATEVPTSSVPIPDLTRIGLSSLKSFDYQYNISLQATIGDQLFVSSWKLAVKHQASPLKGQYTFDLQEPKNKSGQGLLKTFVPEGLYPPSGVSISYTALNGLVYAFTPPNKCVPSDARTSSNRALINTGITTNVDTIMDAATLAKVQFVRQEGSFQLYSITVDETLDNGGKGTAKVDIFYLPDDKLVHRIHKTITLTLPQKDGSTITVNETEDFTLNAVNDAVQINQITIPPACKK